MITNVIIDAKVRLEGLKVRLKVRHYFILKVVRPFLVIFDNFGMKNVNNRLIDIVLNILIVFEKIVYVVVECCHSGLPIVIDRFAYQFYRTSIEQTGQIKYLY